MKIKFLFFILLFPLILSASDQPSHFIFQTNYGKIDWSDGTITITSTADFPQIIKSPDNRLYDENDPDQPRNAAQAKLIAKKKAEIRAFEYASKLIRNIAVTAEKKISDYISNPEINNKINNFINENFKIEDIQYSDTDVTIIITYHLFGENSLMSLNTGNWDADYIHFHEENFTAYPQTNSVSYEGLVISAPDIKLTPALSPKIYSQNGNLIYDSCRAERKSAVQSGVAVYGKTPYKLLKPVNLRFYHCAALKTTTFHGTDIVISDEDAAALLSNPDTINNLRHCRVIILSSDK